MVDNFSTINSKFKILKVQWRPYFPTVGIQNLLRVCSGGPWRSVGRGVMKFTATRPIVLKARRLKMSLTKLVKIT
jgi:hypothetical protein